MKLNYFKPTRKKAKKFILAMQGTLGTASIVAFFTNNPKYSVYFLVLGAVIDFLVRLLSDGTDEYKKDENQGQ